MEAAIRGNGVICFLSKVIATAHYEESFKRWRHDGNRAVLVYVIIRIGNTFHKANRRARARRGSGAAARTLRRRT